MENEGMGAQGLSAVDKKITIVLGEASSLPTLTHISNSLKLPRALLHTEERISCKEDTCSPRQIRTCVRPRLHDCVSFGFIHICKYPFFKKPFKFENINQTNISFRCSSKRDTLYIETI